MGPFVGDPLLLEHPGGDETRPHLLVPLFPRLPPVRIVLAYDMDDISLPEIQPGLFAWLKSQSYCEREKTGDGLWKDPYDVSIQGCGKVEEGPDTDAILPIGPCALGWDQLERDGPLGVLLETRNGVGQVFLDGIQKGKNVITRISRTSLGVLPRTSIPLTSTTSSPGWMRPERSAAPPCITRAMTIFPVRSSVLIVAP